MYGFLEVYHVDDLIKCFSEALLTASENLAVSGLSLITFYII